MKWKPLVVGLVLVGVCAAYLLLGREPVPIDATAGPPLDLRVGWVFDPGMPAAATAELGEDGSRVLLNLYPPDQPERPAVFELDRRTGRPRWAFDADGGLRRPVAPPGPGSPPLIADAAGRLFALHPDTGAVQWERAVGGPLGRPSNTLADEVFVPAGDRGLMKLRRRTGEPVWAADIGAAAVGRLQFDDDRVFVLGRGAEPVLAAVRIDSGEVAWRSPLPLPPSGGDFWAGAGLVIVPLADLERPAGGLVAFDPITGRQLWHRPLSAPTALDPHLHKLSHPLTGERTLLLAGTADGTVWAIEATSGRAYWTARVGSPVVGPPAFAWMYVFAATADGRVVALDEKTGTPVGVCDLAPRVGGRPAVIAATVGPRSTLIVESDTPAGRRVRVVQLEYVSGLTP